jgi:hypothetical protein
MRDAGWKTLRMVGMYWRGAKAKRRAPRAPGRTRHRATRGSPNKRRRSGRSTIWPNPRTPDLPRGHRSRTVPKRASLTECGNFWRARRSGTPISAIRDCGDASSLESNLVEAAFWMLCCVRRKSVSGIARFDLSGQEGGLLQPRRRLEWRSRSRTRAWRPSSAGRTWRSTPARPAAGTAGSWRPLSTVQQKRSRLQRDLAQRAGRRQLMTRPRAMPRCSV